MKHNIILLIGSNHKAEINIERAREMLAKAMTDSKYTSVLETPDVDGSGTRFLNVMAYGETEYSYLSFRAFTKKIQTILGRTRKRSSYGIIDIDIDILMYDNQTYKEDDWMTDHVQQLVKELS